MNDLQDHEIDLFNEALTAPAAERAAYLKNACEGDSDLYRRLEALLKAHTQAGSFLNAPAAGSPLSQQRAAAENLNADLFPSARDTLKTGDRIGRYQVLQQIGEGGCGAVYLAEQQDPVRREVAIKVIKLGMDTKSVIARFEAERQALAMLDHPNIAKVFDAGATETGRPFFVMELIKGVRITDYCDQNSLSARDRINLFIQACRAVQHAHQKGIIHRDLKPSNILVTVNDGVPMAKVIDFGIAKATQGRLTDQTLFTASDQFMGTPAYMSPEQSVLTSMDVDTRSDIYSLGVLLYELLIGHTPFDQKELLAIGLDGMRRAIRETEPMRPSTRLRAMVPGELKTVARNRQSEPPKLIHLVRGDLDWIVMKCLEKDRARRYDTVNGLAMELQRFLRNEPIVARPPSASDRLRKLIRRHRLVFTAAGAVVAALCLGLGVSTWQYVEKSKAEAEQSRLRVEAQRAQANESQARRRAEAQELAARKKAYASDMILLQQALGEDDLGRAQELLDQQRRQEGQQDLRGWEWRYLSQFCQSDDSSTLCRRSNSITSVSFSNDGTFLAVSSYAGEVTVWDVALRRLVFRHVESHERPSRLAFAPKGNLLAFYDGSNSQANVVLWDADAKTETKHLPLAAALRDLAFSRNGRLVTADLSTSNNVTVWDVASGNALDHFTASLKDFGMGTVFALTDDGTRFAQVPAAAPSSVRVADVKGELDSTFRVSEELTTALAFSPDGRTLLTGGGYAEGAIRLWDVQTRQLVGTLEGHRSWVSCVKFLADGRTILSASADGTIRLWDYLTRQLLRTFRGHSGEIWTIDVSPDGRWIAGGCKDGSVSFWNLNSSANRLLAFRTLPTKGPGWWEFSPNSKMIGALEQGSLKLYDTATLQPLGKQALGLNNIWSFGFSPDTRWLVAADSKGQLGVWDMQGERVVTNFTAHLGSVALSSANFAPDGNKLLTYGTDGFVKVWDLPAWTEARRWQMDPELIHNVAISTRAKLLAAGREDGLFELISTRDPARRRRFTGQNRTVDIDLSRDGKIFAAASENGTVELWDTDTLTRTALMHGVLLGYHSVAISPDGKRVAAGSNGQEAIKIWDLPSHETVATLRGNGSFFSYTAFSPDGNHIGARNWNGAIHIWSAPSWEQIEARERIRRASLP